MDRLTTLGLAALAATVLLSHSSEVLAQEPVSGGLISMFCKTSAGGKGFVMVTLSNLTTLTIPKGKILFAKKGDKTIKFKARDAIPNDGIVTFRTYDSAFQVEGPCDGWN